MTLTRIDRHLPGFTEGLVAQPIELRTEYVLLALADALEQLAARKNGRPTS